MKKSLADEVEKFVLTEAVQNKELVYYPPNTVMKLLQERNICVNKMYLIRMYARLNIIFRNGLWTKEL